MPKTRWLLYAENEMATSRRKMTDGTHCSEAAELAALRLADVRARLADLMRMEAALSKLVRECGAHRGDVSCPLIAALRCCY